MTKSGFKLKANLLGAALLASLALVGCQQTNTPPPVDEGTAPVVSIVSPAANTVINGDEVAVSVRVQHTASLTVLKYQFAGGSEVSVLGNGSVGASAVVNTTERNFKVMVPAALANGAAALKVTATDSKGRSNSTETAVNVNRGASAAVDLGPPLELESGRVKLDQTEPGGTRQLAQNINGEPKNLLYARGKIQVSATPRLYDGMKVKRVEFWIAESPSSPALDYIGDVQTANASGVFKVPDLYDTRRVISKEGKALYMVARVTLDDEPATNFTASKEFYVDNSGPESPDLSLQGAMEQPNTNFLLSVCSTPDNNWARGVVRQRLTNADLEDVPARLPGVFPSGLEAVTYYYLPRALESVVPSPGSTLRAKYIRDNVVKVNGQPVSVRSEYAGRESDYRKEISTSNGAVPDGAYTVYAVMHDQLGNEMASNFGFRVSIDNTAPVPAGAVEDSSPLPFRAVKGFLSDYAAGYASAGDAGVGFLAAVPVGSASFGNKDAGLYTGEDCGYPLAGTLDVGGDTNYLADGPTNLVVRARDILGNQLAETVVATATVDNTDPEVDILTPLPGQVVLAGSEVDVNVNSADSTSEVRKVMLFWNDFVPDWQTPNYSEYAGFKKAPMAGQNSLLNTERFRDSGGYGPGFIAAPVQFAESPERQTTVFGAKWYALYPRGFSMPYGLEPTTCAEQDPTFFDADGCELSYHPDTERKEDNFVDDGLYEPMRLHAWAIDQAGNVRMLTRRITVQEVGGVDGAENQMPILGNFDAYKVGNATNYNPVTAGGFSRENSRAQGNVFDSMGGTSTFGGDMHNVDVSTLSTDGQRVNALARAALNRWNGGWDEKESQDSFLGWLMVNDPSLDYDPNLDERRAYIEGWAEIDQDAGLVIKECDADPNPDYLLGTSNPDDAVCEQDVDVAPWFLYANTFTSSGVNRSQNDLLTDDAYRGMSALGYVAYGTDDSVDPRVVGEYNLAFENLGLYGSVSKGSSDYTTALVAGKDFSKSWVVELYNLDEALYIDMFAYGSGAGDTNKRFMGLPTFGFGIDNEGSSFSTSDPGDYAIFYKDSTGAEDGYVEDDDAIGLGGDILANRDVVATFTGYYRTRGSDVSVLSGIGFWIDLDNDSNVDSTERGNRYSFSVIP